MRMQQAVYNGVTLTFSAGYRCVQDYVETLQLNIRRANALAAQGHRHAAFYRACAARDTATLASVGIKM